MMIPFVWETFQNIFQKMIREKQDCMGLYIFSVDYKPIPVDDIVKIHKHLINKYLIK